MRRSRSSGSDKRWSGSLCPVSVYLYGLYTTTWQHLRPQQAWEQQLPSDRPGQLGQLDRLGPGEWMEGIYFRSLSVHYTCGVCSSGLCLSQSL